jgi:nucleotide-binding universal stress UspA family protein
MNPILIGYDGSAGARYAIEYGGKFFTGRSAIVVTAFEDWPPAVAGDSGASASVNAATRTEVEARAREGVELARAAGFDAVAEPHVARRKPWQTLIAVADEHDADLILVGSHGFNGLRPLVLGSVSHQLVHHAHQPVLAVPTPEAVTARREQKANERPVEHAAH